MPENNSDLDRRTSRRRILSAMGSTLLSGLAGCLSGSGMETPTTAIQRTASPSATDRQTATQATPTEAGPVSVELNEGFEDALQAWDRDWQIGPETDEFDWAIERTTERARSGQWGLRVFTEGRHDDGTAWITRPISVQPNREYRGTATAYAWSESSSFNTMRHLVMFLGPAPPDSEHAFPSPGEATTGESITPTGGLRQPLDQSAGWRKYEFEWHSPVLDTDTLYLAVGVTVVWEVDRTYYVDDINLSLEELVDQSA